MRIKKTKALRYVVATIFTIGTVLSVGFLSFSGLWIIYPYVVPAIVAFFLSGVIEGKVFGTGIFKGLARLKLLGFKAQQHLLILELNRLIMHKIETARETALKAAMENGVENAIEIAKEAEKKWLEQYKFLKDYWRQRKSYKDLKENPYADESELKEAKKRLEDLKDYFYDQIKNKSFKGNEYFSDKLKDAGTELLQSATRSVWLLRSFWLISISIGVVSGFATAFAVQEAITVGLALSLSVTAISAIVWPIAIFAGIGATFLLYYAITDIVKNDAIERAFSNMLELFKRKTVENTKEPLGAYLLRLLSLSMVMTGIIGLTIFATAASGGTFWIAMQKGIKLLAPKLPVFIAYCASAILIPINFATDLIYGLSTTLQTVNNCKGIIIAIFEMIKYPVKAIKIFFSNIETQLDKLKEKESWGQFFNPFRILAKLVISPFQSLVFLGHLISIGLTTDRCANLPPVLVAAVCAGAEGLQDLSFITHDDGDDAHDGHDAHDHENLLQLPLQVIFSPLLTIIGTLYWAFKQCGNEKISFFDAIGNTFGLPLLNIVFFPLLLPSAIWHWTFKKSENTLTFFGSIKKNFDIHEHGHECAKEPTSFELSQTWREKIFPVWMLNTAENRLNSAKIDRKIALEKQQCLEEFSSEEGLNHVINNLNGGKKIEEVLSEYTAGDAKKSEKSNTHLINGYSNGQTNGCAPKAQDSFKTIFERQRGFFSFNKKKPTTTAAYVKDAFSLVIPNVA